MTVPTFDFSALTTRAACDLALEPAQRRQARLIKDEANLDFDQGEDAIRARVARRQLTKATRDLAGVRADLADLAADAPAEERQVLTAEEARLVARQLTLGLQGGSGADNSLQDLEEALNEGALEIVTGYITQLEAYRLTLPA